MNDRQFAAAHDRYLDPPDYEEERPDCEDEDRAYEEMKQRRIDEEDWLAETMRQRQECEE
ncbi:MAG: hypothetical protein KBH41_19420 [Azonexus sp.]|nr:hypothetical protein [Azonexus sp.]